jgi:RNA polymerase sigma factor (sigma-70 family)
MEQTENNVLVKDEQEILLRAAQVYLSRQLERNTPPPNPIISLFWDEFHRFYAPIVIGMVRHFWPDLEQAEDIAQEAWLIILRKLPEFHWRKNPGEVRAWIAKIVHDKAVDYLRRKSRLPPSTPIEFSPEAQHLYQPEGNDVVGSDWRSEVVQTALDNLRAKIGELNFQIIHLHYWQGSTVPEIAAVVGLTADQVYARQKRVLQKLRMSLGRLLQET